MVNQTPDQPTHEYDWQNPNRKTFDFGRVFGNTFSSFFGNFKRLLIPLLIATFVLSVFSTVTQAAMTDQVQAFIENPNGENMGGYLTFTYGIQLVSLLFTVWFQLVVIHTSYSFITKNETFTENLILKAFKYLFPVFFMALIYFIVCIFGVLFFLVGFIFVWPGWALAGPVYVIERKGVFGSLGRAWTLANGNKRWILLLLFILVMILFAFYLVLFSIMAVVGAASVFDPTSLDYANIDYYSPVMIFVSVLSSLVSFLVYGMFSSALTAAYIEIRGIKEGGSEISKVFS